MTPPEIPDQISELVTKIKLLEEDNLLLAERAEETLLIALIGESINNLHDSDEVINCVLERIAFLKDIPYCACLPLGNDAAEPSHVYATFREKDCAGDRLQLTPALLRTMEKEGHYIYSGELRSGGIDLQVEGADFTPQMVMLIPFSCRAIPRGSFVFADNDPDQKRFESLVILLQRIVDMTVTKLDIIFLVNDLEELTAALDQKVLARTASLNDVNKKLRKEIRERQRSEDELRRFRLGIERSGDAIFLTDKEGVITYVNHAFENTYGYSYDEAVGQTPRLLKSGEHSATDYKTFWETILAKEVVVSEMINKTKAGRLLHMAISANPILDKMGEIIGFLAIQQDITDRRQAEVERESLITDLEQKNAEMERFNYTVSHDLKSPLITIKGFTSLLEEELAKDKSLDGARDAMGYINRAVDKMHLLLDDLLELSRVGRLVHPSEEFSLGSLVEEIIEQLSGPIDEGKVNVEISTDLPKVSADRIGISQVMQNLIENAVKFMGDQNSPQIAIGTREEEGEQIIYIQDNGIGIDLQLQDRIFGLFRQLDPSQEGSGVGLTLVKRIIELHGGHIWVESKGLGAGSTFCFTLPK